MAAEVGQATIKLTFDTKSLSKSQSEVEAKMSTAGSESGSKWGSAWSVAAGNLIAKGIEKVSASIANNMSNAVKRVDTMNNFPKVMQNLGISAESSAKVIDSLSDKLIGLPTTLDAATLAVQRFTSKNGDVEKSEKIFLAVNNAILAGGASADIQSSALEQLSQAYAKGKPDMMEWRTLQQAMPAQLKQIAKAMLGSADALDRYLIKAKQYAKANPMSSTAQELLEQFEAVKNGSGDMTTALGTALRTGVISMEEFTDSIIKMNDNGVDGFASLSKQAKDATGGIATSMTNLNTAISRALANMLQSIGPERINQAIKGLINFINSLGKSLSGIVKFVIDNGKTIITILTGIGGAIAGAFVTEKIIGFTRAIKSMTSSLDLSASTVVGLATGVISLAVAIAEATDDVDSRISDTSRNLTSLHDAITANKKSWDEIQQAQKDQLSAGMSEMAYYESLADELGKIVDENGRVKAGYEERAGFITTKLKDALGVEINYTNGIIKGYSQVRESINQVIAQKKAKIILDSQEAGYTEAIKKQTEALQQMGEANSNMSKKHSEAMMLEYQLSQMRSEMTEDQINSANARIQKLKDEEQQYADTLKSQEEQYGKYTFQIGVYEDNMAKFHAGKYDEMNTATWDYISKMSEAEDAEKTMLETQISETRGSMAVLEQMYKDTGNETYNTQYQAQKKKLESLQASHKQYENATKEGMKNVNAEVAKSMQEQLKTVDNTRNQWWMAGTNIMDGLAKGIGDAAGGVIDTMVKVSGSISKGLMDFFGIHSPSRLMAKYGRYIDEGLAIGIASSAAAPVQAASAMSGNVASAITGTPTSAISMPTITDRSSSLSSVISNSSQASANAIGEPVNVTINNQINSELDAQNVSQVMTQAIRRAI